MSKIAKITKYRFKGSLIHDSIQKKHSMNNYLNVQKQNTSELDRLVKRNDTFWMPEINPVHIICEKIHKIHIF